MRIWSILLIKSDLKWCIHLSRSLFLYFETKLTKLYVDFNILSRGYNYFHENSKFVHFILRVFNFLGQKSNFRGNLWWSSFGWCIHKMTFWEHILLRKLNILHAKHLLRYWPILARSWILHFAGAVNTRKKITVHIINLVYSEFPNRSFRSVRSFISTFNYT